MQSDLKDGMGFKGFIMSDWWALHSFSAMEGRAGLVLSVLLLPLLLFEWYASVRLRFEKPQVMVFLYEFVSSHRLNSEVKV